MPSLAFSDCAQQALECLNLFVDALSVIRAAEGLSANICEAVETVVLNHHPATENRPFLAAER